MAERAATRTGGRAATTGVIPGRWCLSVGDPGTTVAPGFTWQRLTDLARLESGHTPSRREPAYWGGDIPWVGVRDATGNHGRTITRTREMVTQAGIDNSAARVLPPGTVCVSRTASVGYVVVMGVPMSTSQDFVNWVCGPQLDYRYLKYVFLAEQESLRRFAYGTTHQTIYFPEVKAFHVCVPDVETQQKVANVLTALDEKIENCEIQATLCDELITALFKRAVISGSAREVQLFDIVDVDFGEPFKSSSFVPPGEGRQLIRIRDLKTFSCQVWTTERRGGEVVVQPGDVVVGMDAEFRPTAWLGSPGLLNQRVCRVRGRGLGNAFVREALRGPLLQIERYKTGTTVIHLNKGDLEQVRISVPSDDALTAYERVAEPLYQQRVALAEEVRSLAAMRDALLPELVSGRVQVRDAELAMAGAV